MVDKALFSVCLAGIIFMLWFLVNLCMDHKAPSHPVRPSPRDPARGEPRDTQWINPFPGETYDYRKQSFSRDRRAAVADRAAVAGVRSLQDVWDE
ncbi:MAG TPA: hypothetical protein VGM27_00055 [Acidobacteriaceae bacterium]